MESFPKFEQRGKKEVDVFENIKTNVIELCRQMKGNIESGAYDALVSDEAGGRIPTLILREIIKLVRPGEPIKTLFVAAGHRYNPYGNDDWASEDYYIGYPELESYLKKLGETKKVLIVTQIIGQRGYATRQLADVLKDLGNSVDIATLAALKNSGFAPSIDNVFIGGPRKNLGVLETKHNVLSGIAKSKKENPMPIRLDKAIDSGVERSNFFTDMDYEGLYKEWNVNRYGLKNEYEIKKEKHKVLRFSNYKQLSTEEKTAIQENINRTRGYIKQLAKDVVKEVWPDLTAENKQG
jgi:hypothetical protein